MEEATKLCKKCNQVFPVSEFKYGYTHCYSCQKQMSRDWKARNKERANELSRLWKLENQEKVSAYNSTYSVENRATVQARSTAYHVARAKTDPDFKLAKMLRNRYKAVLKDGRLDESSLTILGCSIGCFKSWLQYRFASDMTFENHGKVWALDHVVPIAKFELTANEDEIRKCFHWSNFQPLHAKANQSKNCNATQEEIKQHEQHMSAFLNSLSEEERAQYSIIKYDRIPYITKPQKKRSNRVATKVSQE